jgi:hypothetical protein
LTDYRCCVAGSVLGLPASTARIIVQAVDRRGLSVAAGELNGGSEGGL